jgi:transcriptional regulator with XRE-family HTH domain
MRLEKGYTLRAYCATYGEDPAYISRLERGILEPPKDEEVLRRLAKSLGLKQGTEKWKEFHDLAFVSAGRIPPDVMEDENLVKHLPLFFRMVTGEKFPSERLDTFVTFVKDMYTGKNG